MITALIDLLGTYYQAGDATQMAVIARSILDTIPDDLVALQFLGLALYQLGRTEAARRIFRRVAESSDPETATDRPPARWPTTVEAAATTSYRAATEPASGLAEAWQRIALLLARYGFHRAAGRALDAARAARGQAPLPPVKATR